MRINHHIAVDVDPENIEFFAGLGLDLIKGMPDEYASFAVLDIFDDDPRWPGIWRRIMGPHALDVQSTQFDKEELRSARYVTPIGGWDRGYPMPDGSDGEDGDPDFHDITYDSTHYCRACGTGLVQKAPFRMRGEPKWGRRSLMGLNWISDEVFTTPTV